MAHQEQREFVTSLQQKYSSFFKDSKILEIGSLNVNGTVRDFFQNCDYLGIDVGPGPGVDIVCKGEDLNHPDNTYDTVLSTECFEHTPSWFEIFKNMIRMTKPGGLVFWTCASTGRAEHGTKNSRPEDSPLLNNWDYYKNLTKNDFELRINLDEYFSSYEFTFNEKSCDLYFFGFKK